MPGAVRIDTDHRRQLASGYRRRMIRHGGFLPGLHMLDNRHGYCPLSKASEICGRARRVRPYPGTAGLTFPSAAGLTFAKPYDKSIADEQAMPDVRSCWRIALLGIIDFCPGRDILKEN